MANTIPVPPLPPIAPIQPRPKPAVLDVLRGLGLPAEAPGNPVPQGTQEWSASAGADPRRIAIQGQPRPVAIQGPPPGMTPDQDALLKMAMAQAANPVPTLAGGMQTATRVNMPAASAYLARPGAPGTHQMTIQNGANTSNVTFGGPGNDILAQQDLTPMSPEDITRRMAGQLAPSEEQRVAGMQMYEAMLKNRGDILRNAAEAQNLSGRLDLDRQIQLGELGMKQQQHQLGMREREFALGQGGALAAATAKMRADGMSEVDIQRRVQEMIERGQIYSPLADGGSGGYGGGGQPMGTPPSTQGQMGGQAQTSPRKVYQGIEHVLNEMSAEPSLDGKTPGVQRGVGAFLWKLDQARPGFVQQNWPAIQAYIVDRFGSQALASASMTPSRASWTDLIPGVATAKGIYDLATNPDARTHWENYAALPLSVLGPLAPLGAAVKGGDNYLVTKPDDEALGRSALRKLLGKE